MSGPEQFYNQLADDYHLIYQDWKASSQKQAGVLDSLFKEYCQGESRNVLDLACGIGTQSLGLAALGYEVTGVDISPGAVERAKKEAQGQSLNTSFSVGDMREPSKDFQGKFDAVICCDNSVPHLLTDEDIFSAFQKAKECLSPGGIYLISVRDYDAEGRGGFKVIPHGLRDLGGERILVYQTRTFDGDHYEVAMHRVRIRESGEYTVDVQHTQYYAVGIPKLMDLMKEAGFSQVERLDGRYPQPLILAR